LYDYILIDIDKRLDDINLGVLEAADTMFVVMTADLSCLKNVRLVLETIGHLGYESSKVQLVLNRSNAFTGINVKNAEGALKRTIDHQIVNEYRGAISALNSGAPFMFTKADSLLGRSMLDFARVVDRAPSAAAQAALART
jgi:pilus assembly protein CpaE